MADTNKRDYYEALGVKKDATEAELKKAYRRLAKENHPDLHPGDETAVARSKEVNEAYGVLSDKEKKARYDQYGHAGVDPNFGAGGGFDGIIAQNLLSANTLIKSWLIHAHAVTCGAVVGAKVPIALTSRSAAVEESFLSLVFCAVLNEWRKTQAHQ